MKMPAPFSEVNCDSGCAAVPYNFLDLANVAASSPSTVENIPAAIPRGVLLAASLRTGRFVISRSDCAVINTLPIFISAAWSPAG